MGTYEWLDRIPYDLRHHRYDIVVQEQFTCRASELIAYMFAHGVFKGYVLCEGMNMVRGYV